ncbi:MAG: hypothetical protein RBS40_13485 [Rhodocyclaceae bacterium]|jgi:hypothetical protein|nr:hypothetical protein [Rhodocyclaceae bacterium]
MPELQLRQHYISGGSSSYSSADNTNFYIQAANLGSEIDAFLVLPASYLHGKKVRYTRTLGGSSGSKQKWIWCEVMDGAYDRASATHWPSGAPRANLGNGRLALIEETYAYVNTSTITSAALDLSGASGAEVTLFWRIYGQYTARTWSISVTSVEILDAADNVVATLDIDGYTAEGTTSGQNYGTMGVLTLATPVIWMLSQPLGLYEDRLKSTLEEFWRLYEITCTGPVTQPWGLRMGADLVQPWADALVRRAGLVQPWDSAGMLVAPLAQRWQDLAAIRGELDQPWQISGPVAGALAQPWAILGAAAQGLLAQPWDLPGRDTLAAALTQPWSIGADASLLRYTVEVLAAGQPVRVSHLNIEGDLGQDVLSCEVHPETEGEYLLCALGAALQITVTSAEATSVFQFVVTAPRIDEQHGQTRYVVEAMSPAVLLGEPWATPIDGEHSGLASAIAASLAAPLTLSWQTVDWSIPAATLIASQQTPLALLKQVAAAVGAVVQSLPDGSLRVLPEYPLAVPAWPTASPDQSLTETLDLFTTAATPDIRQGHNKFLIGDQMTSADTLRLEEEALTATTKLVRGYQTPWTGAFILRHTGGAWVQIEPLGIETRQQTETIEIVAGSGRTQYPIVSRDAVTWGQVNLGTVTFSEDGTLSASVAGESLLTLTYTTRCRKWRVRDPNNEQLQLVADL